MVSADVAERGGSRLAEQRGGVAQQSADADVFRVRDVGERRRREHGGRPGRGGGGGREVGQALRQAVHVDLDLWVVEVFLAVAVVRVAVPAASRNIRKEKKMSAHLFNLGVGTEEGQGHQKRKKNQDRTFFPSFQFEIKI